MCVNAVIPINETGNAYNVACCESRECLINIGLGIGQIPLHAVVVVEDAAQGIGNGCGDITAATAAVILMLSYLGVENDRVNDLYNSLLIGMFFLILSLSLSWYFYHLISFYLVAFFDIIIFFEYKTTFISCFYFLHIIFKSLQ